MSNPVPYFVVIPVRGAVVQDHLCSVEELFSREWLFVRESQLPALAGGESLQSNLTQICRRLGPDCLLLVRQHVPRRSVWDESEAESLLAALNMAALLEDVSTAGEFAAARPLALFRARYFEYCDLPLAFGPAGVLSSGHTSRMGLLARDALVRRSVSREHLERLLDAGPGVLRSMASRRRLTSRDRHLRDFTVTTLQAFDTLSQGAFVAHVMAAVEVLVEPGGPDSSSGNSWTRRLNRLKVLVGSDAKLIHRLAHVRNEYVHSGRQLTHDSIPFIALAVAV